MEELTDLLDMQGTESVNCLAMGDKDIPEQPGPVVLNGGPPGVAWARGVLPAGAPCPAGWPSGRPPPGMRMRHPGVWHVPIEGQRGTVRRTLQSDHWLHPVVEEFVLEARLTGNKGLLSNAGPRQCDL